jgi:hypothetical protein
VHEDEGVTAQGRHDEPRQVIRQLMIQFAESVAE